MQENFTSPGASFSDRLPFLTSLMLFFVGIKFDNIIEGLSSRTSGDSARDGNLI
jgi:hypothetical protein